MNFKLAPLKSNKTPGLRREAGRHIAQNRSQPAAISASMAATQLTVSKPAGPWAP